MKKILLISVLALSAAAAGMIAACGTTGEGSASSASVPYYSGKGGKGESVAVLVPEGKGLSAEQNYLPTLVQGVFVADFAKYSAISVLDRQALEKTLREAESGIYAESADVLKLGEITKTGYILSGSVTKTSSGYSFSVTVADTKTGAAKAAYSGACTVQELDNFSGIKKASLELLTQMGVELNDKAKAELSGADNVQQVKAQTALAQGITAQKAGNTAASLAYYYTANQYDATLKEAAARANQTAAAVRTGNLGEDIRNKIAWEKALYDKWQDILREAKEYVRKNAPNDALVEFAYSTKLKLEGIDYQRSDGSATFSVAAQWRVIQEQPTFKMLEDLQKGLKATGKYKEWKMVRLEYNYGGYDPYYFFRETGLDKIYYRRYSVTAELYNDRGESVAIDSCNTTISCLAKPLPPMNYIRLPELTLSHSDPETENKKKINTGLTFKVDANKITDNMTIKITKVEEYNGYSDYRSDPSRSGLDIIPISIMK